MSDPQRIRLSRAKGWRMPQNAVKVDRSTKWGNPFVVGIDGNRQDCVILYAQLMSGYLCLSREASIPSQKDARAQVDAHLAELRGKDLACWCPLPKPGERDQCHAAVLLTLANAPEPA